MAAKLGLLRNLGPLYVPMTYFASMHHDTAVQLSVTGELHTVVRRRQIGPGQRAMSTRQ